MQDELDWKLLDQLHGAVIQISSFCFEIKKFCVSTLFVVLTLLVRFTGDQLDASIFVTPLVVSLSFWFLDATGYYYQVKLRGTMDSIRDRLAAKERVQLLISPGERFRVIESERVNEPPLLRVLHAGFNHSMWIYGLLIAVDLALWAAWRLEAIQ